MANTSLRKISSYALHESSGQARVRIDGKDHYLGQYNSPESHESYARLIADWAAASSVGPSRSGRTTGSQLEIRQGLLC
jgi:hypothetical protein